MKKCTKCGVEKDESEFHRKHSAKDMMQEQCKSCVSVRGKAYYAANRDVLLEKGRLYAAEHRDTLRAKSKAYDEAHKVQRRSAKKAHYANNSVKIRAQAASRVPEAKVQRHIRMETDDVSRAKALLVGPLVRSKRKGIPINITQDDLLPFPTKCPVLGIDLKRCGNPTDPSLLSVDRVIPALGYVKGNVNVISFRANILKRDATIEELELVLAYMKRHAAQQEQQEQGPEPCNT